MQPSSPPSQGAEEDEGGEGGDSDSGGGFARAEGAAAGGGLGVGLDLEEGEEEEYASPTAAAVAMGGACMLACTCTCVCRPSYIMAVVNPSDSNPRAHHQQTATIPKNPAALTPRDLPIEFVVLQDSEAGLNLTPKHRSRPPAPIKGAHFVTRPQVI